MRECAGPSTGACLRSRSTCTDLQGRAQPQLAASLVAARPSRADACLDAKAGSPDPAKCRRTSGSAWYISTDAAS